MKIQSVRHIDGPNIYIYKPILVARVDLEGFTERESYEFSGFPDRLLSRFPGLREHHCAKGAPGGFVERLYGGTYFGHIVEHLAIELACLAGIDVHYGKTLYAESTGIYDIVMECKAFECQRYLLERAIEVVEALVQGRDFDVTPILDDAKDILCRTRLGPSTQSIVDAALKRGIPVRRLNQGSLIQLGYGAHRKLVEATITDQSSSVAVDIAADKNLTKEILTQAGIPVPEGALARSAQEAVAVWRELQAPVAVKPYDGNQGKGVSLNLSTEDEILEGFEIAAGFSDTVLVERYIEGDNLRFLVVKGNCVAVSHRVPARVIGDGVHCIRDLIHMVNNHALRGEDHEKPLTKIRVDDVVQSSLRKQRLTVDSIPAEGQVVWLRESANLSTGGEAMDVTDEIHPLFRAVAERAARIIGLDVCGIDMVIPDFTGTRSTTCAVIEVNAAPGIRMHQYPSYGTPRDVALDIVDSLYPNGATGRIPIVAITGTNGKTTTTRLIGHAFARTGKKVGMTTTGGVYIDGSKVVSGDTTGPVSARMVLADPAVDVAVLETARGGIVRGGLAYDKANVAVLTNITLDHVGQDGVESLEDILRIKSLVAECVFEDGTVVLNADDEQLVNLSKRLKAKVAFFSTDEANPVISRHLARGGVAYYTSRGWLVETRGSLSWDIVPVADIPLTVGGTSRYQIENCLAAAAALRAMGLTRQQVSASFTTFVPAKDNRGRCMMYRMPNGVHVILDYGHNPDGFAKFGQWLQEVPHQRLVGVIGVPGDRADDVVRKSARSVARYFDALVVKEDEDKRGRKVGEIAELMCQEIRQQHPAKPCLVQLAEVDALAQAVQLAQPGDVVAAFYEALDPLEQWILRYGGRQVSEIQPVQALDPTLAVTM